MDEDLVNQSTESDGSSQICSILTTTDQEQQRQYRQWTLEEKERLLLCVARCFTLNLPIYTAAHRNPSLAHHVAYYQMQHAAADFKTFLSSYCHLNQSASSNTTAGNADSHHVSLCLYRHICFFCENRGLIVIRQVFESAKNTRMLPLPIAHALFVILTNLRNHLNTGTAHPRHSPSPSNYVLVRLRYHQELSAAHTSACHTLHVPLV